MGRTTPKTTEQQPDAGLSASNTIIEGKQDSHSLGSFALKIMLLVCWDFYVSLGSL